MELLCVRLNQYCGAPHSNQDHCKSELFQLQICGSADQNVRDYMHLSEIITDKVLIESTRRVELRNLLALAIAQKLRLKGHKVEACIETSEPYINFSEIIRNVVIRVAIECIAFLLYPLVPNKAFSRDTDAEINYLRADNERLQKRADCFDAIKKIINDIE